MRPPWKGVAINLAPLALGAPDQRVTRVGPVRRQSAAHHGLDAQGAGISLLAPDGGKRLVRPPHRIIHSRPGRILDAHVSRTSISIIMLANFGGCQRAFTALPVRSR